MGKPIHRNELPAPVEPAATVSGRGSNPSEIELMIGSSLTKLIWSSEIRRVSAVGNHANERGILIRKTKQNKTEDCPRNLGNRF
jgi:hypothetical protein